MKSTRQAAILNLIDKQDIRTQKELAEKLKAQSFNVTQATVSRDIKEMRLLKVLSSTGVQVCGSGPGGTLRFRPLCAHVRRFGHLIQSAGNIIVIRRFPTAPTSPVKPDGCAG